jgi:hypothetical protein
MCVVVQWSCCVRVLNIRVFGWNVLSWCSFFSRVSPFAGSLLSDLVFVGVMFCVSFCAVLVGVLLGLSGFDWPNFC